MPRHVLFVCTGNICRSPTAEGVFRRLVSDAGLEDRIHIDSCGIMDWHTGNTPDPRSIAVAGARGYAIGDLRARAIKPEDFERFDLILAMDRGHLAALEHKAPNGARSDIRMFLEPVKGSGRMYPTPITGISTDSNIRSILSKKAQGAGST